MNSSKKLEAFERIVFYDGECGFCNKSVEIILRFRKKEFYFVALQSPLAKNYFNETGVQCKMDTLYFLSNTQLFERTKAVIHIGKSLKFPYSFLASLLKFFPTTISDYCYDIIARNRKKILSNKCYLPTKKERHFFLS